MRARALRTGSGTGSGQRSASRRARRTRGDRLGSRGCVTGSSTSEPASRLTTTLQPAARHLQVPDQEHRRRGPWHRRLWLGRGQEAVPAHPLAARQACVLDAAVTCNVERHPERRSREKKQRERLALRSLIALANDEQAPSVSWAGGTCLGSRLRITRLVAARGLLF